MIDFYTFATPNSHKVAIALEELQLPYTLKVINLAKGEQLTPEFLAINPANKVPVIVDHDVPGGMKLSESGAILFYLAEKTGRLMPSDAPGRAAVMQWLMFQMSGIGPMYGQVYYYKHLSPRHDPLAIERYHAESLRLTRVLEQHLSTHDFLAREYSIADISLYPFVEGALELMPDLFTSASGIIQWAHRVGSRPAVQRGMKIPVVSR